MESGGSALLSLVRGIGIGLLLALAGTAALLAWIIPGTGDRPRRLTFHLGWLAPVALTVGLIVWLASLAPGGLDAEVVVAGLGIEAGRLEVVRLGLALLAFGSLIMTRNLGLTAGFALGGVIVSGAIGHTMTFSALVDTHEDDPPGGGSALAGRASHSG